MCPNCRAFITTSDKVCPYCEMKIGPRAVDGRGGQLLGGVIPETRMVTVILLTLNVGIFAASVLASMKAGNTEAIMGIDIRTLSLLGAARADFIAMGQWWRFITAGFLHGGLMHILFNMWALQDIGANTEEVYGPRRMICIWILSTIGGFYLSMVWNRGVSVGASAGLFGLIGAMIAVGVLHKTSNAAALRAFYTRWAIYGLLMGLLPFFRVDNAAHIGGLITGFVSAYLLDTPGRGAREQLVNGLTALLTLTAGYAFVKMFLFYTAFTNR